MFYFIDFVAVLSMHLTAYVKAWQQGHFKQAIPNSAPFSSPQSQIISF